ncbi:MAG: tRNA 2-thiouridine(34) synthase MnmA, partial [Clostridia bacterium]|nr:tRNA 2-thiouridine(34) synthase MnmA [Clostridia bacterium]
MRYLVAMSGGVDSSAAAYLLLKQGHCVEGAIMRLSPFSDGSDVRSAEAVCRELGINLRVLDLRAEFERYVIGPFCDQYLRCRTPNPCVFCNNKLKFGAFLDHALAEGFDGMATGHYAAITERNGRYAVSVAACAEKDQSYFLWDLDQRALSKTVFPLCGAGSKDEVRRLVKDAGLPVYSRGDSQDICFVPDGEYGDFIREHTGADQPEGDFVDEDGKVLGRHKGLLNYTIGQRRYLNVAAGRRIFVIGKDAEKNTVTLGDGD